MEFKVEAIKKYGGTDENGIKKRIQKADKERASYYNFYTGKGWGDPKNYHFNIDSSVLGVEGTSRLIKTIMDEYYK
jgi:cytidylate kinase